MPCCKLVHQESDELQDTRNLRDEDLRTLAHVCLYIEKSSRKLKNQTIYLYCFCFMYRKLHKED